tara:strand:- start:491 stop:622 length:132 start_codon:yes stop_codon:yes gene_type:complete
MVDFRMAYDKSGMGSRPARDWNNNTLFFSNSFRLAIRSGKKRK